LAELPSIKAQIGYKHRTGHYTGKPSLVVDNTLDRQFDVNEPDQFWVADFTYIRTLEGFAYFAIVIDRFSRRVIGWSLQSRSTTELALQSLLASIRRRKPKQRIVVHYYQGSQYTSMDWSEVLKVHNLKHSMNRRGTCHDNAVVESFFNLLKRERVRRKVYKARDNARQDIFDYIEMFCDPKRKHVRNGMLSPIEY
jgi:putative transposase